MLRIPIRIFFSMKGFCFHLVSGSESILVLRYRLFWSSFKKYNLLIFMKVFVKLCEKKIYMRNMGRQYKQLGGKIWILLEARIFNTDGSKSEKVTRVLKLGWNLTVPVYIQQLVPRPIFKILLIQVAKIEFLSVGLAHQKLESHGGTGQHGAKVYQTPRRQMITAKSLKPSFSILFRSARSETWHS